MLRATLIATAVAAALVGSVYAQTRDRSANNSDCDRGNSDRASSVQRSAKTTINGANPLDVDTGGNGGIIVRGSEQRAERPHARGAHRRACGHRGGGAAACVRGPEVDANGGTIRADGPKTDRDSSWSVAIELDVPRNMIRRR